MARLSLDNSVKYKRLLKTAKPLGIGRALVRGLLETLWDAANAGSPVIGDAVSIEIASEWEGSEGVWFKLLSDGRWIEQLPDGNWRIKDYWDHCPDFIIKREARTRSLTFKGLRQSLAKEYSSAESRMIPQDSDGKKTDCVQVQSVPVQSLEVSSSDVLNLPDKISPQNGVAKKLVTNPAAPEEWPPFLATEWAFLFAGTSGSERDTRQLDKFFKALIDGGHDPGRILECIRARDRPKQQTTWQFEKQYFAPTGEQKRGRDSKPQRRDDRYRG